MRVAFVSVPRFACAVEMLRQPQLARRPLIVGDAEVPKRVLDCSRDAGKQHVQPGMTIRSALIECPDAVIVPPDPVLYRGLWEAVLDAFADIAPEVEDQDLGCAYLNVDGLLPHYRDESALCERIVEAVRGASGLAASVGIAAGKLPAYAAASRAAGKIYAIDRGEEALFLAPIPVDLLPFDEPAIERLHLLAE